MYQVKAYSDILQIPASTINLIETSNDLIVYQQLRWLIGNYQIITILKEGKLVALCCGHYETNINNNATNFKINQREGGILWFNKKEYSQNFSILFKTIKKEILKIKIDQIIVNFYNGHTIGLINNLLKNNFSYYNINADFIIPIQETIEDQLTLMEAGRRNEIKQALAREAKIIITKTLSEFEKPFYELYLNTMKRKNVTPMTKDDFALYLKNNSSDLLNIVAMNAQDTIAGVSLVLDKKERVIYYHFSATNIEFSKLRPMEKIFYEIFKWAQENNYKYFNLMSTSCNNQSGVFKFKKQWGGEAAANISLKLDISIKSKLISLIKSIRKIFCF